MKRNVRNSYRSSRVPSADTPWNLLPIVLDFWIAVILPIMPPRLTLLSDETTKESRGMS